MTTTKVRNARDIINGIGKEGEPFEKDLEDLAVYAEKAERYEDMCEFLSELVKSRHDRFKETGSKAQILNESERNLLSVAFKNVVGALRSSWRTFNEENTKTELAQDYKAKVEADLTAKCKEVLAILEEKLIPSEQGKKSECEVFYLKMSGDYYRYLSEFVTEAQESDKYKKSTEKFYKDAFAAAETSLAETHPTRLGLALNFSVCYYEILKQPREACDLAKKAFDDAIQKLDTLNDTNYKDSTLIMQLLRDNLTLWTSEGEEQEED